MRHSRVYSKSGLYHVVIRGVNKQNIFYDDNDRSFFIDLLKKYSNKYNIMIYAYCLMDNHVHLEFEDPDLNISIFMQCLCSVYARCFNKKYDRIGHLFQERYASEVIENTAYFLVVLRYILKNPEKAGICKCSKYKWSSYSLYRSDKCFVKRKLILDCLGNLERLYFFINELCNEQCLEIELRPSEKSRDYIDRIKLILGTENPIIQPDLDKEIIRAKIKKLKQAGLSIRIISRITGISKYMVQYS